MELVALKPIDPIKAGHVFYTVQRENTEAEQTCTHFSLPGPG